MGTAEDACALRRGDRCWEDGNGTEGALNDVIHEQDEAAGLSIGTACAHRCRDRDCCGSLPGQAAQRRPTSESGQPPPEWSASAGSWPAHNHDLANTRATTRTPITPNGPRLRREVALRPHGSSAFGAFASTPIVLGDTVYLQDLNSNVYALDRATGRLRWRHLFDEPNVGPNGVSFGWGRLYGATTNASRSTRRPAARVVAAAGAQQPRGHRDRAAAATTARRCSARCRATSPARTARARGRRLGARRRDRAAGWRFDTVSAARRCGATRRQRRRWACGIRRPSTRTAACPLDRATRAAVRAPRVSERREPPGPNLYTNSLVALDGADRQAALVPAGGPARRPRLRPHDPGDRHHAPARRRRTEVVLVAGKMGKVYAYRADNGRRLWTVPSARHQNDTGPLPRSR